MINRFPAAVAATAFALGTAFGAIYQSGTAQAQAASHVFEIRTYTTHPGKLEALNARFRNHTVKLLEKHGMTNIGYWTPADAPLAENTLIYVVAHKSRDAAKASWDAFRSDPDWVKVRTDSEAAGPINVKVDSVFLNPTDYSPLK